jgi:predicted negative regulator of RcsB-dependent stress response
VVLDHLGDVLTALDRKQEALDAYRQALEGGFANQEELNEKIKKMAR